MKITRFEDIQAWQAARKLMNMVYDFTETPAFNRHLRLRDQLEGAAGSTMANIAEGFDSGSDPEFRRFLRISKRSGTEIQSHLYICLDRHLIDKAQFDRVRAAAEDVKNLIRGFIRYLSKTKAKE